MALLLLTINILALPTSSISCGDGQNGSPPQSCGPSNELNCLGFEQCATDSLTCSSSDCSVVCSDGTKSCFQSKIYAQSASGLTLICDETSSTIEGCKGAIIHAPINAETDITCNGGQYSCTGLIVYAHTSTSVSLSCEGYNSCLGSVQVFCGSGSCDIHCLNNQACTGLQLNCGTAECNIECTGLNSCNSVTVNASNAESFQCNGGSSECQPVYNNLITSAPTMPNTNTNSPTTVAPSTSIPTTSIPTTNQPTNSPITHIPTTNIPTTYIPTTFAPTTHAPSTNIPTTLSPTTTFPTTDIPTTFSPTTDVPSTNIPTTFAPTVISPTNIPTTFAPTDNVITQISSKIPTTYPTNKGGEGGVNEKSTIDINGTYDYDKSMG
eukprot:290885_1